MPVKIFSCVTQGLEGKLIEVEADILQGLSAFSIVGLGDAAVQEAKERIRSAVKNSGFTYPQQKKVINLAPAHLKKHGPHFDLPMAVGLLCASGQMKSETLQDALIVGELALDGSVRAIHGVLTMVLFAKKNGWEKIIIPRENYEEASLVKGIQIIPADHLTQFVGQLQNLEIRLGSPLTPKNRNGSKKPQIDHKSLRATHGVKRSAAINEVSRQAPPWRGSVSEGSNYENITIDLADIKGHEAPKKALQIAAAGGHHLLLTGPPGTGKTMLAKALPGILPPLSEEETLEVMQIYSCAGLFGQLSPVRPFRQVHSSCSLIALTGGGSHLHPGEISLAHQGVLFMDEVAEFPRAHLESLRQPLEQREIYISRFSGTIKYPANFTLIAGMNPCPCGYYRDEKKECVCKPYQILQYQKKLSGPLLDRLDLIIEVPRQEGKKYQEEENSLTSAIIRKKVTQARRVQTERFKNSTLKTNASMGPKDLKKHCPLDQTSSDLLLDVSEKFNLSGRSYHQIIKTTRTIADLNQHDAIQLEDLTEALQYRTAR